jgi:hypothetical protein
MVRLFFIEENPCEAGDPLNFYWCFHSEEWIFSTIAPLSRRRRHIEFDVSFFTFRKRTQRTVDLLHSRSISLHPPMTYEAAPDNGVTASQVFITEEFNDSCRA